jgi:transposase InsO family protein
MLEIHSDNGSEFINHDFNGWRLQELLGFTHSRSYHKNDNCFAEQRNGDIVRRYTWFLRYDTPAERNALAVLYQSLCPLLNYFMPTRRLLSKTKIGSKYIKKYDTPSSPYQRLLDSTAIPDEVKAALSAQYRLYNPVVLQDNVYKAVNTLMAAHAMKSLN